MVRFTGNRVRALAAAGVITVAGATGVMATAVSAQQPTATPPAASQQRTQQASERLARLAQNLGVTVDKLQAALKQTALEEVDAAVARGDLTAQQAQQAKDRINSGDVPGFGFGFGGRGGHEGGPGGGREGGAGVSRDQLAQFLGVTTQQLETDQNGKSLAQVAQAYGKSRDQLIQFITTTAQQQLAAAVTAGRITQQQADQRLSDLKARVGQMVDQVHQEGQRPTQPAGGTQ